MISPFSFLILLIWFFSLCFLMSLANSLSILFTFSKNQLLSLLIFAMVSFVSFAFISALIFKFFFPSTNPGVLHFSFSSCFRCRVRLFIWLSSWWPKPLQYCKVISLQPIKVNEKKKKEPPTPAKKMFYQDKPVLLTQRLKSNLTGSGVQSRLCHCIMHTWDRWGRSGCQAWLYPGPYCTLG